MTTAEGSSELLANLCGLAVCDQLSERDRAIAARLYARMTSRVQVSVQGPDLAQNEGILRALIAGGAVDADISMGSDIVQADIVLWCTQSFDPTEQAIWNSVPDHLKDHSFLIAIAAPSSRMADLQTHAEDGFLALFPVADMADITAVQDGVARHIVRGLQAVADSAHGFVHKHAALCGAHTEITPNALANIAGVVPFEVPANPARRAFKTAAECLSRYAQRLNGLSCDKSDFLAREVLEVCSEASAELVDVLMQDPVDDPAYVALCDAADSALDNITLMSLEDSVQSACDAAAVVLQIRKEVHAGLFV